MTAVQFEKNRMYDTLAMSQVLKQSLTPASISYLSKKTNAERTLYYYTSQAVVFAPSSDDDTYQELESLKEILNLAKQHIKPEADLVPELKDIKYFIFPLVEKHLFFGGVFGPPRDHWVTLFYEISSGNATVIDSRPQYASFCYPISSINDILAKGLLCYGYPVNRCENLCIGVQEDSTSCGPWTAVTIESLAHGRSIEDLKANLEPLDKEAILQHNYDLATNGKQALFLDKKNNPKLPANTAQTTLSINSDCNAQQPTNCNSDIDDYDDDDDDDDFFQLKIKANNPKINSSIILDLNQTSVIPYSGGNTNINRDNNQSTVFNYHHYLFSGLPIVVWRWVQTMIAGQNQQSLDMLVRHMVRTMRFNPRPNIEPRLSTTTQSMFPLIENQSCITGALTASNNRHRLANEVNKTSGKNEHNNQFLIGKNPDNHPTPKEDLIPVLVKNKSNVGFDAQPRQQTFISAHFQLRCIQALIGTGGVFLALTILTCPPVAGAMGITSGVTTVLCIASAAVSGASLITGIGFFARREQQVNTQQTQGFLQNLVIQNLVIS